MYCMALTFSDAAKRQAPDSTSTRIGTRRTAPACPLLARTQANVKSGHCQREITEDQGPRTGVAVMGSVIGRSEALAPVCPFGAVDLSEAPDATARCI